MAPAARAAAASDHVSPTTTHALTFTPRDSAAESTIPGCGLRQPHPSPSSWGQLTTTSNGPINASTRAFTASSRSGLINPLATPLWFVTSPTRSPPERARSSASGTPGTTSTRAGSSLYGTSTTNVPSRSQRSASGGVKGRRASSGTLARYPKAERRIQPADSTPSLLGTEPLVPGPLPVDAIDATDAPRRVAVVRALPGLGDALCSVPALRALRSTWPSARVTMVGMRQCAWLRQRFPGYVDEWMSCDVWPGLPEIDGPPEATEAFIETARARRFDLAIQMHGDGRVSNGLTRALGARRWVGLMRASPTTVGWPAPASDHGSLGPYPIHEHEISRCLAAVRWAGGGDGSTQLEFPVHAADREEAAVWIGDGESLAVVHPGASTPARRWRPDGFAAVASQLLQRVDRVVLTGGTAERELTAALADRLSPPDAARTVDLAGATSLGALAAVVERARLVVANDTGIVHLAAAVGTPSVVLVAASDRRRWAPLGPQHRVVGGRAPGTWPEVADVVATVDDVVARVASGGRGYGDVTASGTARSEVDDR